MQISKFGIDLIKGFEEFRAEAYICPAGKLTIGYGHVILPAERGILDQEGINRADAERMLEIDLEGAEEAVNRVGVPLTQNQFDALVSFAYNVGAGAFAGSTLVRKLRAGDYPGAAAEFPRWCKANGVPLAGLLRRRNAEKALFERT